MARRERPLSAAVRLITRASGSSLRLEAFAWGKAFATDHVLDGFALARHPVLVAIHNHLGGTAAGIVVAGHAHAVGAGAEDRQQLALGHLRQLAAQRKVVTGLADGA